MTRRRSHPDSRSAGAGDGPGGRPGLDARGLRRAVVACEACPRLRRHCREVAETRRAAYRHETYWGRPVPTTGPVTARLLVVGLAPAAHGANRTGRMFTGDRSGDFLYAALHRAGFASAPTSERRGDGTRLIDCAITAAVRCAPPGNRPARAEILRCRRWLQAEWDLRRRTRVVAALGGLAFDEVVALCRARGLLPPGRRPRFSHGAEFICENDGPRVIACYHPSQQNTFTGRLTESMIDSVFRRVRDVLSAPVRGGGDQPTPT